MKKNIKKVAVLSLVGIIGMSAFTGCGKDEGKNASARKIVEYNVDDYVKELGAYTGLTVDENITVVTDADVQSSLDSLVSQKTTQQAVTDRAAKEGDTVVINYNRTAEGADIEDKTGYSLKLGSGTKGEDFESKIVGLNIGDSLTFTVKEEITDSTTNQKKTVDATYSVNLSSISEDVVPEVTDAFIAENSEYKTIAEYKEGTKKSLEESNATSAKNTAETELIKKVVEASTVTGSPTFLYNLNYNTICQYYGNYATMFGYDLDSYLSMTGSTLEDLQKQAVDMTIETLVIEAIAKDAKLEITDEYFDQQIQEVYVDSGNFKSKKEVLDEFSKEELTYDMRKDLVIDYLYENNTVNQKYVNKETTE